MILKEYIQDLIRNKTGYKMNLPYEFEMLSKDIFEVTGNTLSVNTLKRLFGKLPDVSTSETTLNILAGYLGFSNWAQLQNISENGNSRLNSSEFTIHPKDLTAGTRIEVCYEPARKLLLQISEDKRCTVISSISGKLQEGDILDIAEITVGYSLIACEVERNGQKLGRYVGGIEGGVKSFKIV